LKANTHTHERINALRILKNASFNEMASALDTPVYIVKLWCGQRLSFAEKIKMYLHYKLNK